jgi:hypothetical protein
MLIDSDQSKIMKVVEARNLKFEAVRGEIAPLANF